MGADLLCICSPHNSDIIRYFLTKMWLILYRLKNLTLAFRGHFSSLKYIFFIVETRKSNIARSNRVKRTHRCQGWLQFFNLGKIHQIHEHINNMSEQWGDHTLFQLSANYREQQCIRVPMHSMFFFVSYAYFSLFFSSFCEAWSQLMTLSIKNHCSGHGEPVHLPINLVKAFACT